MNSGIYKIQSILFPDRFYIGSAKDILRRKRDHWHTLRKGTHVNRLMQRHVDKYGLEDLSHSLITHCEASELLKTEQFYIDTLKPTFNLARIAGIYPFRPKEPRPRTARIPDEVNYFLLLQYNTAQTVKKSRKHTFICTVCGCISYLTLREAKAGRCACRALHAVKSIVLPMHTIRQPAYYNTPHGFKSATGYQGVTYDKQANAYRARLKVKGKLLHIGNYPTPSEAHEARQARIKALRLPVRETTPQ